MQSAFHRRHQHTCIWDIFPIVSSSAAPRSCLTWLGFIFQINSVFFSAHQEETPIRTSQNFPVGKLRSSKLKNEWGFSSFNQSKIFLPSEGARKGCIHFKFRCKLQRKRLHSRAPSDLIGSTGDELQDAPCYSGRSPASLPHCWSTSAWRRHGLRCTHQQITPYPALPFITSPSSPYRYTLLPVSFPPLSFLSSDYCERINQAWNLPSGTQQFCFTSRSLQLHSKRFKSKF